MQYITAMEAARRLGVNEKTVRLWVKKQTYGLTAHHPNGAANRLAIAESDIERIKRERNQYQTDTSGNTEQTTDASGLEERIKNLEQKYVEVQAELGRLLSERILVDADTYLAGDDSARAPRPSQSRPRRTQTMDSDLPEGYILLSDFAKRHGVAVSTAKHHALIGFQTDKIVDRLEVESKPRPNRPGHIQYYLSPEQQEKALAFWDRHHIKHNQVEA